MKSNLSILFILILLLSCNQENDEFMISGKLSRGEQQMIYLQEMTSYEMITLDSCLIDTAGQFVLKGTSATTKFFAVHTDPENLIYLLAGDGDEIRLSGDAMELSNTYIVEGSAHSELIRKLTREQNRTLTSIRSLSRVFNDSIRNPNFDEIKARLDSIYSDIVSEQREFTFRFIEDNLHSLASLMALYQQIGPRHYLLNPEEDFLYFAMVDSSLSILYPESDAVNDLHRQVEELRQKKQFEDISASSLGEGMTAPEIALPNPDGDTILLSSTRGKIVLLDFWAAWCSPCRRENPNLVRAYKKYKDKGFEIYQVSLDQTKDAWLKGIEDDKLSWIHVSDLQYWNSIVVPIYNIQGIPMSILLDREGKIMDQNLRGPMLENKLKEIFNP
jgi:peroxiredoxin